MDRGQRITLCKQDIVNTFHVIIRMLCAEFFHIFVMAMKKQFIVVHTVITLDGFPFLYPKYEHTVFPPVWFDKRGINCLTSRFCRATE
jgi:hypothetical protein